MSGMKLSPKGPDIPVPFLNRLQDDQVVFFCGAGVSVRSGLPDFKGLVQKLFSEFGEPFDGRRYDYDRMLEELENNYSGVREKVRRILAPDGEEVSARRLENHRNLLRLASFGGEAGRVRLVTTNFDDRFRRAAELEKLPSIDWHDAPTLPMPEDSEWASLVHLHGRILGGDEKLKSLILTSSDFGRAYLIQGWARRFIVQLLREWHVAFVGYGLNDPPMRYLMDAAAAIRRRNPDSFRESYAFAPCGLGHEEKTLAAWKKKGITTPILYRKGRGIGAHSLLWKALGGLADLKENPLRSRENIALMDTEFMPEGDTKERVIWALKSPATAQSFAKGKFFPDTADGKKFIRWLDEFKKEGLFRADNAAPVDALDCPPRFAPNLPSPAKHLIDWVVRHTHQPSLLRWLAKLDGSLHPGLVRALHRAVIGKSGGKIDMPEELRELWGIFLQSHPVDSAGMELLDSQAYLAKNLPPNARLELSQRILSALRPLPVVVPEGPSVYARQSAGDFGVRVKVGCELMRFWGRSDFILRKLEEGKNAILAPEHAEALSAHLERALSIMAWREMPAGGLACLLPEADAAYRDYREGYWKFLARMVRNAVRKLVEAKKHRRLANLISRWAESEHPLLWRMALYAAAEAAKHFPEFRDGGNWGAKILVEKCGAFWGDECRPECLRFLRRAGGAIGSRELSKLERAIRDGPPEEFHSGSFDGSPKKTAAVRMAKLKLSEAKLSPPSEKFLAAVQSDFPDADFGGRVECRRLRGRMGGWKVVPQEDKLARIAPDMSPEQCADMIQKFREEGVGGFAFGLVERSPEQAVATYEALAARSVWDGVNWGDFLATLANRREIDDARATRLLRMLDGAPDGFLADNVFNVALALENIAEFRPFSDMEKIWRRAWEFDPGDSPTNFSDHHTSQLDIAINRAHGQLAEIPLICFGQGKERNKLLDVLAEILASEEPSHRHGQILIGSRLSPLFHGCPEWARRHLLPFFAPEHPMAFGMWEAFLYHPTVSVELLAELKPGLMRFLKQVDDFHERANNLVGVFVIGCLLHPEIIPRDEKRRVVAGMSLTGIQHLCWHMERDLWDGDGAALAKTWRELVFPFLREVWPKKRRTDGEASDISRALASVIILTGDAFPEAFQWAQDQDFLSPIAAGHAHQMHPVMDFLYGHQEQAEGIPDQFPRECLLFLDRVVPDEEFLHRNELGVVLDKIKAADPGLEKHPAYIRLRKIASGG